MHMTRGSSAQRDAWPLGAQIAARVLTLYAECFGSVEPLFQDPSTPDLAFDSRRDLALGASPQLLNRICSHAVNHLAAHERFRLSRGPLGRTDWRVILYCLSGAATLREAIARCTDCFEALDGRCGQISLRTRADAAELRLAAGGDGRMSTESVIELFGLAEIHRLLGALIAQPLPLRSICVNTCDPWLLKLELSELPCAIDADEGWTGFVFPAAYLDHPVVCSTDDLDALAQQSFLFRAEHLADRVEATADWVRRLALRALRDRRRLPPFDEIAATAGASAATLRRRLAAEGTNYREIRESCRRELGLQLLRRPALSIEEIAARLDYCDADAFRRAFLGWFGAAPSRFRRAAATRAL